MAIWAYWAKSVDRIDRMACPDGAEGNKMMHVNKVSADFSIYVEKVKAANTARVPIILDAFSSSVWVALEY